MLGNLKSKLKASSNFPSPPAIAQQIIALAQDPSADISQIAAAIGRDSALAAKVLRVANSALYSRQRKSANLRQALIVLGLQGATTLALGLSLIDVYRNLGSNGVDYDRYWRLAILSASAARCFAVTLRSSRALDDIFLAALLQDIAILGIDRTAPDFYRDLPRTASHREFAVYEMARLGVDHAELGAWLLRYWKLPEPICRTVAWSHSPVSADRSTAAGMMARCVALGSECVEMLLAPDATMHFASLARQASDWLGMDSAAVAEVMVKIVAEIPEIVPLFDTKPLQHDAAAAILDQARDLLLMRNLPALGQASSLRETSSKPEPRITELQEALQDEGQRDRLTGLYNRGYLDLMLRRELQAALTGNWPLSLVLVDLDDFQAINETRGREVGDSVLLSTAELIASVARDTDCLAKFGDAQFVIVLPGLASAGAKILCERVITGLSRTFHEIGSPAFGVTASVGLATHAPDKPCQRVSQLINAAERAACLAKNSNHHRQHKSGSVLTTVKT